MKLCHEDWLPSFRYMHADLDLPMELIKSRKKLGSKAH